MKIAFIGDQRGKVHFNRYSAFSNHIKEHSFTFFTVEQKDLNRKCRRYDAVYYASASMIVRHRVKHKRIFGSITSWKCLKDKRSRGVLKRLGKFYRVSANNLALAEELKKYRADMYYLPNGVDTDLFVPPKELKYNPEQITIGWVGNKDRGEKNYKTILSHVRKNLPKPLSLKLVRTKKSSHARRIKPHNKMYKFYRNIDYYLVTSSYEGTPNPALEAAACGVPVITTPVGNMPELIEHGINGFFVKCKAKSVLRRLSKLKNISPEKYQEMSLAIRSRIEAAWNWKDACKGFSKFFTP